MSRAGTTQRRLRSGGPMRRLAALSFVSVALGGTLLAPLRADDPAKVPPGTRIPLGPSGSLELTVPTSWTFQARHPTGSDLPILDFTSKDDSDFRLTITPAVSSSGDPGFTDPRNVRAVVEKRAAAPKGSAGGSGRPVVEIRGPTALGYIYSESPEGAPPSEGASRTTGIVITGPLLLSIDMRSREARSSSAEMGLAMMEGARHLPAPSPSMMISPGELRSALMVNPKEEISFLVPKGWVADGAAPMGIKHEPTGATFAVSFDELVPLVGDLLRVQGKNVAPDSDMAFDMHRSSLRDSLGSDYTTIREGRRRIGGVLFRELVVETAPKAGAPRQVRDFVAWYRSHAYVVRWTVPAAAAAGSERDLDEILSSLNLKARG